MNAVANNMGDSQLGLQEAMAYYAGDDPIQGGKVWLDTLFGMGGLMFELLPGTLTSCVTSEDCANVY